jgi:hypothetical protein
VVCDCCGRVCDQWFAAFELLPSDYDQRHYADRREGFVRVLDKIYYGCRAECAAGSSPFTTSTPCVKSPEGEDAMKTSGTSGVEAKKSRQMAFQWSRFQLIEHITALDKFIVEHPEAKDEFRKTTTAAGIPERQAETWLTVLQACDLVDRQGRKLDQIKKVVVWRTEDPGKYALEVEFLR